MVSVFLHKSHTCEKSGSENMDENDLCQSYCRIFESAVSPEEINEMV